MNKEIIFIILSIASVILLLFLTLVGLSYVTNVLQNEQIKEYNKACMDLDYIKYSESDSRQFCVEENNAIEVTIKCETQSIWDNAKRNCKAYEVNTLKQRNIDSITTKEVLK